MVADYSSYFRLLCDLTFCRPARNARIESHANFSKLLCSMSKNDQILLVTLSFLLSSSFSSCWGQVRLQAVPRMYGFSSWYHRHHLNGSPSTRHPHYGVPEAPDHHRNICSDALDIFEKSLHLSDSKCNLPTLTPEPLPLLSHAITLKLYRFRTSAQLCKGPRKPSFHVTGSSKRETSFRANHFAFIISSQEESQIARSQSSHELNWGISCSLISRNVMLERSENTKKAAEIDLALLKSANCALKSCHLIMPMLLLAHPSASSLPNGRVPSVESQASHVASEASAVAAAAPVAAGAAVEVPACHSQQRG